MPAHTNQQTKPGRDVEQHPDAQYDVVVLGSGGAGLAAAVTAAQEGLRVLVLERDTVLGGTSAISGGALWIPGTRQAKAGGFKDSTDNARFYLKNLLGAHYNAELIEAFLARGPEALAYLEDHSELKHSVRALSPDYYPEVAGSTENGRALEVAEFDGKRLGNYFGLLRAPLNGLVIFGGLMLSRMDVYHFLNLKRSLKSLWHCGKLILRFRLDRLSYPRGTRLVIGNAMVAQLLYSALQKGVKFQINAETLSFIEVNGAVQGVTVRLPDGKVVNLHTRGVVLATGGIGRKPDVINERPDTRADHISMTAPQSDATMLSLAQQLGARLGDNMISNFHWAPMSQARHRAGTVDDFPHIVTDRAKPGVIAVNDQAQRFVNEANSYHRFVTAMRAQQQQGRSSFYLIADHPALRAYGLGLARPSPGNNDDLIADGYLIQADSIAALAQRLNLDAAALQSTIEKFNGYASAGSDLDFHKGDSSYNRAMGDMNAPHACLAPIVTAPFYAVRIHTGDLGAAKGLVTDASTHVLRADGSTIAGLYAVGNDMNSLWSGEYPGPGITLGPGLTFGYVAAKTIVEDTRSSRERSSS